MTYLEGVYWDLDGTIANTELEAHLPAFNNAFNDLGIDWNWDTNTYIKLLKINGGKNRIAYYAKSNNDNFSEDLILKIHETKQFHYLEIIKKNCVSLKTGVFRLINELHTKKVRQFIVTSSSRIQADLLVDYLFNGLKPFEFIISSEDVELKKPNPLPYLKAIQLSGINKNNSIVFEDSNPGLKSSLAANLPTIFVPSNIPIVLEENIKLDCILDSLGDENNVANVIKGPKLKKSYVDYSFLSDTWRTKSIGLISVLTGYFLFANFLTKFISEGKNELIMVPIIIVFIEIIIRIKPSSSSRFYYAWTVVDKLRIGAVYAIILEAFKLGS